MRLSLALLIIFAISRVHDQFAILRLLRQGVLGVLFVGVVAFANPAMIRPARIFAAWPAKMILGLGIMACVSAPFAISIGTSGQFLLQAYWKILVGAFLIIAGTRNVRDLYTLLTAFVIGSLLLVLLSFFSLRTGELGAAGVVRIVGGGSGWGLDSNDIGTLASAGIGVALLLVAAGRGMVAILGAVTALGLVATIARTGSRGGFLGLIVVVLGFLLLTREFNFLKRLALVGVAAGSLALAAPAGYWKQMQTILKPEEDYNWSEQSGRKEIWKRGMGYMWSNPLTGVGIANFNRAEGILSTNAREFQPGMPGVKWTAAHNSFVEAGAEMGLPGMLLFSGLVLGGVFSMVRLQRRLPNHWKSGDPEERLLYRAPQFLAVAMLGFGGAGFFVSWAYTDLVYQLGALMSVTYLCTRQKLSGGMPASEVHSGRA